MSTLVIAEHDNKQIKGATLNTITAASELGEIHLLIAGHDCADIVSEAAAINGVSKIYHADAPELEHGLAESLAPLVVSLAAEYSHVLAPASSFGKNLLPRVAALLDVAQISDVIAVIDDSTFKRPIYAGNVISTVQSIDSIKVITVRGTAFDAAETTGGSASIETISAGETQSLSSFVSEEIAVSERPELTSAKVVVSGGRGLGSAESFSLMEELADIFGGAVGASRAAVDAGYVPNDYQVGQTGKIVAPDLYIAVGISGAIQHLAGMKDSKVIVAINKDEDAPIFEIADYGLVADVFEAVPQLIEALRQQQ